MTPCTICSHRDLSEINDHLKAGGSLRSIGEHFGVGYRSLGRHKQNHTNGQEPRQERHQEDEPGAFSLNAVRKKGKSRPPGPRPKRKKGKRRHVPTSRVRPPQPAEQEDLNAVTK